MTNTEKIAWVRPPEPITGLDHLGVQSPCIALYTQLLPGITNVTDRARYYSFHPWLICSFEQRYTNHSLEEFRRVLRRAECLFALIAIRHDRVVGDIDEGRHGIGMVGRLKLLRIPEDAGKIVLDDYATLDGPNRYFKNKLGGLGQYYFGPLRDLRVLDHSPQGKTHPPGYDRERGRGLADAFARGVPEDAFFKVLEAPAFSWTDLDKLEAFCPCALPANPAEHELLLDLFLARSEAYQSDGGGTRRASLGLMLDLAGREGHPDYAFEGLLRGGAYAGTLPDGSPWLVDGAFRRVQRGWGTYQRNELLSLALQGLFAAVLRAVERDHGGRLRQTMDAADVGKQLWSAAGKKLSLPLSDFIAEVRAELPEVGDWLNPGHELQRGWQLQDLGLDDEQLEEVVAESIYVISALLARGVDEYPYGDFDLDPEYFNPHEIHLLSLRHAWQYDWGRMPVGDWVGWLSVHWGIARHLRVALRKLRGERRDTFRIRPLEGELRVVDVPPPTYTTPRVGRSLQILRDLGLVGSTDQQAVVLTQRGARELEACREE